MSPKSFPTAIIMITVLALFLPLASTLAETPGTRPRNHPVPSAPAQVDFWHRVLDFLDPSAGRGRQRKAIAADAGCEMDPDGRLRTVSAPAPGEDRH